MRQCLQSFSKINLGLINRMIVLPARPHLVYTWAVSDVSIVICHTSGSQGGDWMKWTPNILSNRNYYYPRALRISLPLWHLIKWDIGLMSFTPGHQEPSFSLLQHKWFGPKAGTCNIYKTINTAQVYLPQRVLWPD